MQISFENSKIIPTNWNADIQYRIIHDRKIVILQKIAYKYCLDQDIDSKSSKFSSSFCSFALPCYPSLSKYRVFHELVCTSNIFISHLVAESDGHGTAKILQVTKSRVSSQVKKCCLPQKMDSNILPTLKS